MVEQVFDVGGVALLVRAPDADRARCVTTNLGGFPSTDAAPVASIAVLDEPATTPARPADDELLGVRFWFDGDDFVLASRALVVRTVRDGALAHLPDLGDGDHLAELVSLALTWLLAPHARFVLHAGALARDHRAVLVLGRTGSGKSTLAAAALDAGWEVLADDQVVLDASTTPCTVHGVHRLPAVPREIGGAHTAAGAPLGDPRDRVQLPRDVLAAGGVDAAGVVLATHSEHRGGALTRASAGTTFPALVQSFPGSADSRLRRAFFPVAGALARLPGFVLGHARDASNRRARAIEQLATVHAALSDRG